MNKTKWLGVAAVVVVVGLLAAWLISSKNSATTGKNQTQQPPPTVKLTSNQNLGNLVADSKGMTLYYFAKDNINKSNCLKGTCLSLCPPFYTESAIAPPPVQAVDFTKITRADGDKQMAYKGWPVYYYSKDTQPGDTLGEGVADLWHIVPDPFYTVMIQNQDSVGGNYLSDPKGKTLYYFTKDKQGDSSTSPESRCIDKCWAAWPVFSADNIIAPPSLKKSDFTLFKRADSLNQLAYKGWPLYYYASDTKPGDVKGQNVGKAWFVVKP